MLRILYMEIHPHITAEFEFTGVHLSYFWKWSIT